MAVNSEFPQGVRGKGLKLISDNGSQPTSTSFMEDMATLEVEQIFTSYDNPKGNADTERVIRTIKEEIIWLNEFSSLKEAKEKIGKWIEIDYNKALRSFRAWIYESRGV
ncbi:MAG: integrase core domain-containing protein [Candidatus Zixiibacteriota bacterium]